MLSKLIRLGKTVAPGPVRKMAGRILAPYTVWKWRQEDEAAYAATGGVVVAGPFTGMRYVGADEAGALGPKLLGTYEWQLVPMVEDIERRGYDHIVNIGAAEGYYTVGLLRHLPHARATAFEGVERLQNALRNLARLNSVQDRVDVRGFCTAQTLAAVLTPGERTLVLCDIEGAEREVLDPQAVPQLTSCDILVELHDLYVPGISEVIRRRFEGTHDIQMVRSDQANLPAQPPSLSLSAQRYRELADERRKDEMAWFCMTRRDQALHG